MKMCKDCKYIGDNDYCLHPKNIKIDVVTGNKKPQFFCHSIREMGHIGSIISGQCGKPARWFEPKYVPARERSL
jgi:hypothetical protein